MSQKIQTMREGTVARSKALSHVMHLPAKTIHVPMHAVQILTVIPGRHIWICWAARTPGGGDGTLYLEQSLVERIESGSKETCAHVHQDKEGKLAEPVLAAHVNDALKRQHARLGPVPASCPTQMRSLNGPPEN